MIKNYFKTAWRSLLYSKVYSLIAIFGLAIGLAVSILLFWGINDELTYDTQLKDAADIYRVNARIRMGPTTFDTWITTPAPISAMGAKTYPAILQFARISMQHSLVTIGENHFEEQHTGYTEPSFFDLFKIRFVNGNPQTALTYVNSVVLNRTMAAKYFGSPDKAMGKTLLLGEKQTPYAVSAVVEDMPIQSSVRLDMFLSLDVIRNSFGGNGNWKTIDADWGSYEFNTFLKLRHGVNIPLLENQLTGLTLKNNQYVKAGDVKYILQPLNTLRLYNPDMTPAGIKVVKFFIIIGILIILIAVINYVNLTTARATKRAKEVGLRRVVGAGRGQLISQFVVEFIIIFIISLALASFLIPLLVPVYQKISGKDYPIDYWNFASLQIIGCVAFGTIVLASIYPAWVLSSFKPVETLKATFTKTAKGGWLRKGLVVLQFTFSIMLIICTVVISGQLKFIQTKNLGFNRENVFEVNMNATMGKHWETVINDLKANKSIADVTVAMDNILDMGSATDNINWPGKTGTGAHISPMQVRANFTSMMQMKFAEGQGFTGTPTDSAYYLVNEAAVRMMSLKNPVGTIISLWGRPGEIRGVLKDFNNVSLKAEIHPTIFRIAKSADYGGVLYVKARSEETQGAVKAVENVYHTYNPIRPFDFQFMDDNFDAMYRHETQTAQLFTAFAVVAIVLSCLGLFGLAVFTAERRTKEIGIRKVLGASVQNISLLISSEFAWLVLIANVISWPFAWYFTNEWLQQFAYKISISWWVFAISGIISLLLSVLTVSSQAIKAAMVSPVKSLRSE
jgi:putative ABC transport system permease protein